jgi:hypothetical protein
VEATNLIYIEVGVVEEMYYVPCQRQWPSAPNSFFIFCNCGRGAIEAVQRARPCREFPTQCVAASSLRCVCLAGWPYPYVRGAPQFVRPRAVDWILGP